MESLALQTRLGPIVLSAYVAGPGPLILVIRGAYATEDQYSQLPAALPEVRVAFGEVPGNRTPTLAAQSVGAFAAAYSEALAQLPDRIVVCGVSLGGLIALALTSPNVDGIVAVDPPLQPASSPALRRSIAAALHDAVDPNEREYLHTVFGATPAGFERRDYRPLLHQLQRPAIILAGDAATDVPSTLSEADLAEIAQAPLAELVRVKGVGHAVHRGGSSAIVECLRRIMAGRAKPCNRVPGRL